MPPDRGQILNLIKTRGTLSINSKLLDRSDRELRRMRDEGLIASATGYWYLRPKGEEQ